MHPTAAIFAAIWLTPGGPCFLDRKSTQLCLSPFVVLLTPYTLSAAGSECRTLISSALLTATEPLSRDILQFVRNLVPHSPCCRQCG